MHVPVRTVCKCPSRFCTQHFYNFVIAINDLSRRTTFETKLEFQWKRQWKMLVSKLYLLTGHTFQLLTNNIITWSLKFLGTKKNKQTKKPTKSDDIKCHEKRLELLLYVFPWFLMPFWLSAISGWFDFRGLSPRKGSNSNCLRIYIPSLES